MTAEPPGRIALTLALAIGGAAPLPSAVHAETKTERTVGTIVDVFVNVGSAAGVPISPEMAPIVKGLVTCAIESKSVPECARAMVVSAALKNAPAEARQVVECVTGGRPVAGCATDALLAKVPEQARPLVQCVADGKNVAECAQKAAVGEIAVRAPAEVRPFVQCVAEGGSPGDCSTRFAANVAAANVLPAAKPLVDCVTSGKNVGQCAADFGIGQIDQATKKATDDALKDLKQLKADAEDAMAKQLPQSVRNIILVAEGIRDGDVAKMIEGGTPVVAAAAVTAVLDALFPATAAINGKIAAAVINYQVATAKDLLQAAWNKDAVKAGQIVYEYYATWYIRAPCELVPAGVVYDATCGAFLKSIGFIAGVGGDIAKELLGIAKDVLSAVGIYQIADAAYSKVVDIIDDIGNFLGIGGGEKKQPVNPASCGQADGYFANNYLSCVGSAAKSSAADAIKSSLNGACAKNFSRCYSNAADICGSMGTAFGNLVNKVNAALDQGAEAYSQSLGAFLQSKGSELCSFGYEGNIDGAIAEFASNCTSAVTRSVPLQTNTCKASFQRPVVSGAAKACTDAPWSAANAPATAAARAAMMEQCAAHCRDNKDACRPPRPPCMAEFNIDGGWVYIRNCMPTVPKWFDPGIYENPGDPRVKFVDGWVGTVLPGRPRFKIPKFWDEPYFPVVPFDDSWPVLKSTPHWAAFVPTVVAGDEAGKKIRKVRVLTDSPVRVNAPNTGGFDKVKPSTGPSAMDRIPTGPNLNAISGNVAGPGGGTIRPQQPCRSCGTIRPTTPTVSTAPKAPAATATQAPDVDYGGGGFRPPPTDYLK